MGAVQFSSGSALSASLAPQLPTPSVCLPASGSGVHASSADAFYKKTVLQFPVPLPGVLWAGAEPSPWSCSVWWPGYVPVARHSSTLFEIKITALGQVDPTPVVGGTVMR
eukprot:COSAG02_NODE_203_length_29261_cov_20.960395_17_plen_110_part_00